MISFDKLSGRKSDNLVAYNAHHKLTPSALVAFQTMQQAAKQYHVNIEIASSFRSLDRQLMIWNRKWLGQSPLYNEKGQLLDYSTLSNQEKLNAILTWSALPGTSRHHWGTDVDVYDEKGIISSGKQLQLIPEEYQQNGPCFQMSQWLIKNSASFGFSFPYAHYKGAIAAEPWHISFISEAQVRQNSVSIDYLQNLISDMQIEGKEVILARIDELFARFIQPYHTPE